MPDLARETVGVRGLVQPAMRFADAAHQVLRGGAEPRRLRRLTHHGGDERGKPADVVQNRLSWAPFGSQSELVSEIKHVSCRSGAELGSDPGRAASGENIEDR